MPIKKHKKKIKYKDTQKINYELDLIGSRALISLSNYFTGTVDDTAHISMEKLFRDYKCHRKEVKEALLSAFKFLTKEQFIADPDDPPYYKLPKGPPPSKSTIKLAKTHINQIAKKVWKK